MNSIKEPGLLRGTFALLSQDVVVTAISFLTSVVLARWLGPAQLGLFYTVNLIPLYAEKFGRVGLIDHATVFYLGKKKYGLGVAAGHITLMFLVSSSVILAGYAFFENRFYESFLKTTGVPRYYVWTAVASVPALLMIVAYGKLQLALGYLRSYNASLIVKSFLFFLLAVFFWKIGWDFYGAVAAGFISVWTALLIAGVALWKHERFSFKFNPTFVVDVFKFGWGMYSVTILQFLQQRFDLLVIAVYLTKTEMSHYSLAVGISLLLLKLPGTVAALLYPRVTKLEQAEASQFTARICRLNLVVIGAAALLVMLLAAPVVLLCFGRDYMGLVPSLLILVPGTVLLGISRFFTEYFYGIGRPRLIIWPGVATTLVNILANLLLTSRFGIKTAALVSCGTYAVYFGMLAVRFSRVSGLSLRETLITNPSEIRNLIGCFFTAKQPSIKPL